MKINTSFLRKYEEKNFYISTKKKKMGASPKYIDIVKIKSLYFTPIYFLGIILSYIVKTFKENFM